MIDRRRVAASFGAASERYDAAARLQATTRAELISRLDHFTLSPRVVVDLGAGTGAGAAALARRFPDAQVIAIDISAGMLRVAGERLGWRDRIFGGRFGHPFARIVGDARALPLASGSVDLIFSNFMLQWCDDLDATLVELRRVAAPRALLMASTFGATTLQELRMAFAAVDATPHVNDFIDMHDLGAALVRAGFEEPVLDVDRHRETYPDVRSVMRSLKEIGARNAHVARSRGLFGRGRLRALEEAYARAANGEHHLPVTWEVIHASCFATEVREVRDADEVVVPLTRIGRRNTAGEA